jgi:outer membrane protein OmpA-like peptidoglycan-associated protein
MMILLSLISGAMAQDLEFGYTPSPGPDEKPALLITAPRAVGSMEISCQVGDEQYQWEPKGIPVGVQQRYEWPRDTRVTRADCSVRTVFADGMVEDIRLPLEYAYGGGLTVDLDSASADLEKHTMEVAVSAWVDRAEVVAYGAKKAVLDRQTFRINSGPGKVEIPWVGRPADVVLLDVTLHSETAWVNFSFSPWMLNIPHNDVLFASNDAKILTKEDWKLENTLTELQEVIEQYGDIVPVKLFIGGCTDTVGARSNNRTLSRRRARAIAVWFRDHGYDHPIFYHGFGEDWLAQATGDGKDVQANRRAVYIVSANPPPSSSGVPQVNWTEL